MPASRPITQALRLLSLFTLSWLLSIGTTHAEVISRDAQTDKTTSIQFTATLLGLTASPDLLTVNISDPSSSLCFSEESAQKGLTCETERFTPVGTDNVLSYTPSSSAEAGDTYTLDYTATANYSEEEGSRIENTSGTIVFLITGTSNSETTFITEICDPNDTSAASFCSDYENSSADEQIAFLDTINPDEVVAEYTVTKELTSAQTGNIFGRISELRAGNKGVSVAGLNYSIEGEQFSGRWLHAIADSIGGAAGADDPAPVSNWGFFINGSITDGNKDSTDLEGGYDSDASTITAGVDYRFSSNLIAGFAYGISQSSLEFDGSTDDGIDNDMNNAIVYGTWYKGAFNVDLLLGYSQGEIETSREITLVSSTAKGETDSTQMFFSISSGYDFSDGPLSYGPYASFDYAKGEIEAYDEINGGGLEVGFDDQDINSQVFTMGGRVSYAISTEWGVIAPHARAEWKKEFDNSRDIISGNFLSYANSSFSIEADDFDDNWFHAGVGMSATFRHGLSAYIDYDSIIAYDETDLSTFSYGGRWEASF
ncbi:hypothetical protein A9Q99_05480 [Gammaproteobacteria bacterium 45_16_T64]|nr:hypothetical protein A9Q99_05480 [Gammaproteobacteria bacterium 45_16_T64]